MQGLPEGITGVVLDVPEGVWPCFGVRKESLKVGTVTEPSGRSELELAREHGVVRLPVAESQPASQPESRTYWVLGGLCARGLICVGLRGRSCLECGSCNYRVETCPWRWTGAGAARSCARMPAAWSRRTGK